MAHTAPKMQPCIPPLRDAWFFYSDKHGKTALIKRAEKKVSQSPNILFEDLLRSLRVKVGSSAAHFVVNYLYHVWDYRGEGQVQSLSPRGVLLALWYFGEVRSMFQQESMSSVSEFYLTTDDIHAYRHSCLPESHK
jgi:hypothetical protein